ncbi:MAG: efflux RND transporter periplasmic adaptor subunit [Bacteroidales bacterium]
MIRKLIYVLLPLLLFACGGHKYPGMGQSEGVQSVSAVAPVVKNITLIHDYPGYLTADNSLALVARVNGYLVRKNYNPGQYVKKGDLLFVIEPTLYENAVNQAQAQLDAAEAQYVYADNNYNRSVEAAQSDAISEIDVIQAKSALDQAKANIVSATAALSTAKTNLGYCYVRAPENGKVSVNLFAEGAYINGAASAVTLATVYDDKRVYVHFTVPESILPQLGNLDSLTISYGSEDAGVTNQAIATYAGKIDYISPNVAVATGTIKIRAILENKRGMLKDGLYVTVKLPYASDKDAILVNNNSIGVNQAGQYMYVLGKEDTAGVYTVAFRPVTTGPVIDDTLRVITDGISPSELYINKALLKVRNGSKVKLMP